MISQQAQTQTISRPLNESDIFCFTDTDIAECYDTVSLKDYYNTYESARSIDDDADLYAVFYGDNETQHQTVPTTDLRSALLSRDSLSLQYNIAVVIKLQTNEIINDQIRYRLVSQVESQKKCYLSDEMSFKEAATMLSKFTVSKYRKVIIEAQ